MSQSLPVYPGKQTFWVRAGMSFVGAQQESVLDRDAKPLCGREIDHQRQEATACVLYLVFRSSFDGLQRG
jgi:hypothetical protein